MPTFPGGMPERLTAYLTFEGSEMVVGGADVTFEDITPTEQLPTVRTHWLVDTVKSE